MIKLVFSAVVAVFALCIPLSAQLPSRAEPFDAPSMTLLQASPNAMVEGRAMLARPGSFRSIHNAWYAGGPLTLIGSRSFSFPGTFGWVEGSTRDFLPDFSKEGTPRMTALPPTARPVTMETPTLFPKPDYVGGQVGVFLGKSIGGKYSRDVEAGYILGQIIEGNTQITVGASYGHESGTGPRVIGR